MADECVDVSNKEQLVICLRWVDHCLEVHEDFLGLYHVPDISANAIAAAIKDCLVRMNLQVKRCRANVTMEWLVWLDAEQVLLVKFFLFSHELYTNIVIAIL